MKVERKRIGKERMVAVIIPVVVTLLFLSGVALAPAPPNYVILTEPVKISAEPASIPADGVSTSEIMIAVINPKVEDIPKLAELKGYEEIFSGKPAAHTRVDVKTSLGKLTDAADMNNTGEEISVFTGDSGMATVLLSGTKTGMANIIAEAVSISDMITLIPENDTTLYIVRNSTEVKFIAGEATPSPGNGGDNGGSGGIPPMPPAGTQPYIDISANPADIPADGISTSTITASVWKGEEWVLENLTVNFSTDLGDITASALIENGTATAILTAGTEDLGVATITAEANLNGDIGTVTNTTRVNFTTPGVTPTPAVNVTLTPTPTVTVSPTSTATVSPTPTPSPTKKPLIPGFGAVFAIASLLAVAHLVMRMKRK